MTSSLPSDGACDPVPLAFVAMDLKKRAFADSQAFAMSPFLVEHSGRLVTREEMLEALLARPTSHPTCVKKPSDPATSPGRARGRGQEPSVHRNTAPAVANASLPHVNDPNRLGSIAQASKGKMVGRVRELSNLTVSRRTLQDQPQIVFVTGKPASERPRWLSLPTIHSLADIPECGQFCGQCIVGIGRRKPMIRMPEALVRKLCRALGENPLLQLMLCRRPRMAGGAIPDLYERERPEILRP